MLKISQKDLFWLAGIIEGDGCFSYTNGKPIIQISMTDSDVVERAAKIFNSGVYESKFVKKSSHKQIYTTFIKCSKALVFMDELFPLMGHRRQQKIQEIKDIVCQKNLNKKQSEYNRLVKFKDDFISLRKKFMSFREIGVLYDAHYEVIRQVVNRNISPPQLHRISIQDHISDADWSWVVGLLEAEGSFVSGPPSAPNCPAISIQMTDEDVMRRVSSLLGVKCHSFQSKKIGKNGIPYKKVYLCCVRGRRAVDLMSNIKNQFGERRREQINKVISGYDFELRQKAQEKNASLKRKLSSEDIAMASQMANEGRSLRSIARHFDVHHTSILAALKRLKKNMGI